MSSDSASSVAEPITPPQEETGGDRRSRRQPRYHVILWNDDDHTYEYVIRMLKELFNHQEETGFKLAEEVNSQGRAIILTTTLEHAELKRDQVHAFGKDAQIKACKGSMKATLEAEC